MNLLVNVIYSQDLFILRQFWTNYIVDPLTRERFLVSLKCFFQVSPGGRQSRGRSKGNVKEFLQNIDEIHSVSD